MKNILISSVFRDEISEMLSGKYEIVDGVAELVIFDGECECVPSGKSLAIFKSTVSRGTYSDFITYPFRCDELLLRLERLLCEDKLFENGALVIDTSRCTVLLNGVQVHLTMLEYKLLCLLADSCGETVDYQTIMRELWGSPIGSEIRSVRVFVNALRKKLGSAELIKNSMGKGYVMPKISK